MVGVDQAYQILDQNQVSYTFPVLWPTFVCVHAYCHGHMQTHLQRHTGLVRKLECSIENSFACLSGT